MSLDNFTHRAAAYAKGRPGYPKEAIDKIIKLASPKTVFADIGAGTGKLTVEIAKQGYKVYAVEPNEDMRTQLALTLAPFDNAELITGTAEATSLPDQCVDVLTIAHALHWFDPRAFRKECYRIVKPGGFIIAIYNHVPGKEMTDFCRQAVDAFFTDPIIWTFDNPINYNRDTWLAYIESQDDSVLPNEPGYDAFIKDLNAVFDRDSVNGMICCDRLTRVYVEKIPE